MNKLKLLWENIKDGIEDNTRLHWLLNISIIGLLASLLMSSNAWSTVRSYPLSPIVPGLEMSSTSQDVLFLFVIITLVLSLFRFKLREHLLTIGLVSLLLLVLLDITRLQPWILHYSAILLFFCSFINKKYLSQTSVLDASRLVIGGIYFWSGIQKMNSAFFSEIFPWFTTPLWEPFGQAGLSAFLFIGLFVPFIEVAFALGFFTNKFRKISIVGSLAMLVVVLASIGPTGHSWNSSVWPWNIAIFGMVLILFWGFDVSLPKFLSRIKKSFLAWVVIAVFWIMPIGSFVGLTDHYLAWSLYSGKVSEAAILGNQEFLYTISPTADTGVLKLIRWTLDDLNLVPYPENRVFVDVFDRLCMKHTAQPMTLMIQNNSLGSNSFNQQRSYECNEVK